MSSEPNNPSDFKFTSRLLQKIDFDNLSKAQLCEFIIHSAERLLLTRICCQNLVNEFERTGSPQQLAVLRAFVNDLNGIDSLSGDKADEIAAMGTPPRMQ
ncbi:MAG: hypothetical protein ACREF8_07005 [Chthoniobacterales bacterium]